jgi:Uma2 family endonuclease
MPETIFVMDVDEDKVETMRKPDIAFVQANRINPDDFAYYDIAPDIVVEVLSPSDTPAVIYGKLSDYFTDGTGQAWLVYPREKKIAVHFPDGTATTYESGETLSGGDLLPGFTLDVAALFAR